jgi:heparin/heparan-sulfate lyase
MKLIMRIVRSLISLILMVFVSTYICAQTTLSRTTIIDESVVIQAEDAEIIDRTRVRDVIYQPSKNGVSLNSNVVDNVDIFGAEPDLVFNIKAKKSGRYDIFTYATVDDYGAQLLNKTYSINDYMHYDYIQLKIAVVGNKIARPASKRVVFLPWSFEEGSFVPLGKVLGDYYLSDQEQEIHIWLPRGVILDYIKIYKHILPPKVPKAVANYKPTVVPPASHPRLWVNANSLPIVRANLEINENRAIWDSVKRKASETFSLSVKPGELIDPDDDLTSLIRTKAFVFLMTREQKRGREAVQLIRDYLAAVEFGNKPAITRKIGSAIYTASLVYDWCYDLISEEDKENIRVNLLRFAGELEIGWPPFRQAIVIGHGSELQINRNLLSMSIAIYDEDPIPYKYISYRILEELVPMRRLEYQSPRHNQGTLYGPYRFQGDMYAANLFYRMLGKPVFDENIKEVYKSFFYHRLPDNKTIPYGDVSARDNLKDYESNRDYFNILPLLSYAYNKDPLIKGSLLEYGMFTNELSLLLNDPNIIAVNPHESERGLESLPLTRFTGKHYGSMTARTGWDMTRNSSDVVVDMLGGGYRVANHQHADAGSFQIFYRGRQVVDLGQYYFYGTPYDNNFNKRSVSHSMMLAVDPDEKFRDTFTNDGGNRSNVGSPLSIKELLEGNKFHNGEVISGAFGPNEQAPLYSYFSVDLTSAFTDKIEKYIRSFTFLNLKNEQIPAVLIILDNMTTSNASFKKYWQINTINSPTINTDNTVTLTNSIREDKSIGKVTLKMLRPKTGNRDLEILSGDDSRSVFGSDPFTAPRPGMLETNGVRMMYSPINANKNDVFLTVFTMSDLNASELPLSMVELSKTFILTIGDDRVVVLNKTKGLLNELISDIVIQDNSRDLLVIGLKHGTWKITSNDGTVQRDVTVAADKNTAYFSRLPSGKNYSLKPQPSH